MRLHRLRLLHTLGRALHPRLINAAHRVLTDQVNQLVKHVRGFDLVFHHGVLLGIGAIADAVPQLIHGVNVIHPAVVHGAEQHHALKLPHIHAQPRQKRLALLIEVPRLRLHGADQTILVPVLHHILMGGNKRMPQAQVFQIVRQLLHVPLAGLLADAVVLHSVVDHAVRHLEDGIVNVLTQQHPTALTVNDLALAVHHVVVFQHVLTNLEVPALNTLLGALDLLGEHSRLKGLVVLQTQTIHHCADPLGAEQAHQVVLQRNKELGGAGVALTARTAAQLIINAAALVALGADDMQTARLQHTLVLRVGLLLELAVQRLIGRTRVQNLLRHVLIMARGGLDDLLVKALLTHRAAGEEIRVAAQQNIRAASGHIGGDGHGSEMTGLRHDLGFLGVVLGVQHLMGDAPALQHIGDHFAGLHRHSTHQHRLTRLMMLLDGGQHRIELSGLGLIDLVVQILTDIGLIRGDLHHVQGVNGLELALLRLRRTGHTSQLAIHTEVVLEGDGCQRAALPLHLHMLLSLDGLMQTLAITAAHHQAARELVHDDHLTVLHHVVHVALHQRVGAQGAMDMVVQLAVIRVVQVIDLEGVLHPLCAFIGKGHGLLLFVHGIMLVPLQGAHHRVRLFVQLGGLTALTGDNQGRAGLVDQDGVHLVHDGIGVLPLHQIALADDHVIPQIIEAQLVIRAIGNVAGIGLAAVGGLHVMDDQAHGQTHEPMYLAHPLAIAPSQIVVNGNDMDALARQRVQIRGQGRHQRFAFACFHFSDAALMQHDTAQDLHMIGAHSQNAVVRLADGRECLRQQVVQRFALGQTSLEFVGLAPQLLVGQLTILVLEGLHRLCGLVQFFNGRLRAAAQQLLDKIQH